jgi:hypothetical protein
MQRETKITTFVDSLIRAEAQNALPLRRTCKAKLDDLSLTCDGGCGIVSRSRLKFCSACKQVWSYSFYDRYTGEWEYAFARFATAQKNVKRNIGIPLIQGICAGT